jgi:hypothetical protein
MYIYVITNTATGKIYIGQHKGNNLKKYLQTKLSDAHGHRGGHSHLYASMRKHPKDAWSIEPLMEADTKEELDRLEILLIALYDTRNPEVGYNICKGGEGFTGEFTPEHRKKISDSNKKVWATDPQRRVNMIEKMTGREHAPESIAKMKMIPKSERQLGNLQLAQSPENIAKRTKTIRSQPRTEKQQEAWKLMLSTHHNKGLPKGYKHPEATKKKFSASLKGRSASNRVDMTGKTINGIVVLDRVESSKSGKARWNCRCPCGNLFTALGDNLRSSNTKSCGCGGNKCATIIIEHRTGGLM